MHAIEHKAEAANFINELGSKGTILLLLFHACTCRYGMYVYVVCTSVADSAMNAAATYIDRGAGSGMNMRIITTAEF